jgi:hypothetical protein
MKIQLGTGVRVTAKSDGGLSLYRNTASCSYPVFCLEAKRKKHRLRDSETTHQMHAAQIYAEMLGQTCHKGLYNGNPPGFQEVPSSKDDIDCSHSPCMQDMRRSIYFMPDFQTRIFGI